MLAQVHRIILTDTTIDVNNVSANAAINIKLRIINALFNIFIVS